MGAGGIGTVLDIIDKFISHAENQEFRQELKDLRERVRSDISGQAGILFGDEGKVFTGGGQGTISNTRTGDTLRGSLQEFHELLGNTTGTGNNGLIDESKSFLNVLDLRNLGLEDITALDQAFQARQREGLATLRGFGDVARRDLRRDFDTELGIEQQALQNRGGGGFLASSLRLQNARARQEGLDRLNERLTAFKFGAFERLSGDTLSNRAIGNATSLALEAEPLNARIRHEDKLAAFDLGVPLVPPGDTLAGGLRDAAFNLQARNTAADAAKAGSTGSSQGPLGSFGNLAVGIRGNALVDEVIGPFGV